MLTHICRLADCDTFMHFCGGGIGHMYMRHIEPWLDATGWCHDLVSFSLQILQVINKLNHLTTIPSYLILSFTFLIIPLSYQRQDDIIFKTYTRQNEDIYSSGLEPWNSSRLISQTSSSVSVSSSSSSPSSLPSLLSVNSEIGTKV